MLTKGGGGVQIEGGWVHSCNFAVASLSLTEGGAATLELQVQHTTTTPAMAAVSTETVSSESSSMRSFRECLYGLRPPSISATLAFPLPFAPLPLDMFVEVLLNWIGRP